MLPFQLKYWSNNGLKSSPKEHRTLESLWIADVERINWNCPIQGKMKLSIFKIFNTL